MNKSGLGEVSAGASMILGLVALSPRTAEAGAADCAAGFSVIISGCPPVSILLRWQGR
jgi:hypothetical protein